MESEDFVDSSHKKAGEKKEIKNTGGYDAPRLTLATRQPGGRGQRGPALKSTKLSWYIYTVYPERIYNKNLISIVDPLCFVDLQANLQNPTRLDVYCISSLSGFCRNNFSYWNILTI